MGSKIWVFTYLLYLSNLYSAFQKITKAIYDKQKQIIKKIKVQIKKKMKSELFQKGLQSAYEGM